MCILNGILWSLSQIILFDCSHLAQLREEAFQKEYFTLKNPRVKNIRSISVRSQGLNSKVERLSGTMKDSEKVMRGMHTAASAQKVIDAMRIHYNFCREHEALWETPAQRAGL